MTKREAIDWLVQEAKLSAIREGSPHTMAKAQECEETLKGVK